MAFYDFREYLEKLDEAGELHRVETQVDPNLEAGAIAQRLAERGGPAVHFTKVKGAGSGVTLVGGSMGRGAGGLWAKLAVALELDQNMRYLDILEQVMRRRESAVRPIQVDGGPIKENLLEAAEIDLAKFSPPVLHEGGAPCLSSWAITIVQEPGGGNVVWDVLPLVVTSKNTLAGAISEDSRLGQIHAQYQAAKEAMPFAVVLGAVPVATMAAACRLKRGGETAVDIAGSLQRGPVQLVKCETSDLLVPATAELVLEGVVKPGKQAQVQAFSGTFGYRLPGKVSGPVFEVTAVSHRNDPVLPFCTWGTPTTEIHIARGLDSDAQTKAMFEQGGSPVTSVFTPPWLAGAAIAISTMVPYTAFSQAIAGAIRVTDVGRHVPYILVCDNDIDITNPVSLFHALVTKCHPDRDTWVIKRAAAAADAPYINARDRAVGNGAAIILDCTWPLDWDRSIAVPPRVSFDQCYPQDLQERILAGWNGELGFPNEMDRPV